MSQNGGQVFDSGPPRRVVALDVGGTSMKGAVVDQRLRRIVSRRWPTRREAGPEAVIKDIGSALESLVEAADGPVAAAGVVVPGLVDEERGTALLSVNLGWRDIPMRDLLTNRLGLPVALGQDVRAGGLAEAAVGAAQHVRHALFVAIGTGVAGAILVDGRPYRGDGAAGEIGHIPIRTSEWRCTCGQTGCLETVASATAIARRYAERKEGAPHDAVDVARLATAGDPLASEVWSEAVDAIAAGLATCVAILAPELIVVGGGLSHAGTLLFDPLRASLQHGLAFRSPPEVVPAVLGDEAGCLGAALIARAAASADGPR